MKANIVAAGLLVAVATALPESAVADAHWRGDIHRFHESDAHRWAGGHWYRGRHDGREGWWWVVGAAVGTAMWYAYTAPVYPYPDPYVPPAVIVAPPAAPEVVQPAPPTVWYFCPSRQQYYPYVATCPEPWKLVPATPAQ